MRAVITSTDGLGATLHEYGGAAVLGSSDPRMAAPAEVSFRDESGTAPPVPSQPTLPAEGGHTASSGGGGRGGCSQGMGTDGLALALIALGAGALRARRRERRGDAMAQGRSSVSLL